MNDIITIITTKFRATIHCFLSQTEEFSTLTSTQKYITQKSISFVVRLCIEVMNNRNPKKRDHSSESSRPNKKQKQGNYFLIIMSNYTAICLSLINCETQLRFVTRFSEFQFTSCSFRRHYKFAYYTGKRCKNS